MTGKRANNCFWKRWSNLFWCYYKF